MIDTFLYKYLEVPPVSMKQTADILTSIIVGTNKTRYGPAPTPEQLVAIRAVIRRAVDEHRPIDVLTPWGSRKPVLGFGVDVAELCAITQIIRLDTAIRKFHEPGTRWNMALEDVSGYYLWEKDDNFQSIKEDSDRYVETMTGLADALMIAGWAKFVPESDRVGYETFKSKAEEARPTLERFLIGGVNDLDKIGWKGTLPQEQRDYYYRTYEKLYPKEREQDRAGRLARYLAQSWARHQLGIRATHRAFKNGDYLQLSFPPPVPGMPESMDARRVYMRTVPADHARTHIPPWRAKGYVCINRGGEPQFKLASWHEAVDGLVENRTTIGHVQIESDYVIRG